MLRFDITSILVRIVAVVLAMSVHEMAHALVSYWMGDPTAKLEGRLSLNPFRHIDWLGVLCLMFFGFGWAKPVPIDSRYYKDQKTGIIWTSFAGPLANFILAFLVLVIYMLLVKFAPGFLLGTTIGDFVSSCLIGTSSISIAFGIFNLIPIPPLDGSKILFSFLPDDQYYRFIQGSQIFYFIFIAVLFSGILDVPLYMLRNSIFEVFWNVASAIVPL